MVQIVVELARLDCRLAGACLASSFAFHWPSVAIVDSSDHCFSHAAHRGERVFASKPTCCSLASLRLSQRQLERATEQFRPIVSYLCGGRTLKERNVYTPSRRQNGRGEKRGRRLINHRVYCATWLPLFIFSLSLILHLERWRAHKCRPQRFFIDNEKEQTLLV